MKALLRNRRCQTLTRERGALIERGVAEVALIFFNSVMHFSLAAEHELPISMLGKQGIAHISVRKNGET